MSVDKERIVVCFRVMHSFVMCTHYFQLLHQVLKCLKIFQLHVVKYLFEENFIGKLSKNNYMYLKKKISSENEPKTTTCI